MNARRTTIRLTFLLCVALLLAGAAVAATTVVPDRFLRPWDPVTVFFARDTGPAKGGPEDHPERLVRLAPDHPGAFTWLDARTLQFRPAEPWPSLTRFQWTVEGRTTTLSTLMAAPLSTAPASGAEGLEAVDTITLTFADPLDPSALARMATIELRPLPGLGGAPGERRLGADDFEVKALERSSRGERASYVLELRSPVPLGTRAIVRLRLSLDQTAADSRMEFSFSTAEPFRVARLGCASNRYPLSPDGVRYTRAQAIRCSGGERAVLVEFTSPPDRLGPVEGRNLVRFSPEVEDLDFQLGGKTLRVSGRFARDTEYRVGVFPAPLRDANGRPLEMEGSSELFLFFPREPAYLGWAASQGIVERLGAQMVPVEGRGDERVDLRIHRVDPLDRSFWPFPDTPLSVNEGDRPPGPGEEPRPFANPERNIAYYELQQQVRNLGSPPVSTIVTLPLRAEGGKASFGLDLAPHLARISGKDRPGTYLVGIRRLDGGTTRSWMRVQATDLSLTAAEETGSVRFAVTSLSTGRPVAGAVVRIEGTLTGGGESRWDTLFEGTTDAQGTVTMRAPGRSPTDETWRRVLRIVVRQGDDVLVLDPQDPPDPFSDNTWLESGETWLQWAFEPLEGRAPAPENLCHLFPERPVYRPEDTVHLKGYVRTRDRGRLRPFVPAGAALVVTAPGGREYRYPVEVTPEGSFHHAFTEDTLPTGVYSAGLAWGSSEAPERCGMATWRAEAYRLPLFEVRLHAPEKTPLDKEFEVKLTATYYAGGRVAGRPVQWRVTQFPYAWTPKGREGFRFSSDSRFSGEGRFLSTPRLEREDTTDAEGSASIPLDPGIEPTAQPRTYVVEATVTGADDQTVTDVARVVALPPFVLGLKAPRYLERATGIEPQVLVLGPDDSPLAGQEVTVRLLRREWHSHLRAADFSQGAAKYVTEVVDEEVSRTSITSGAEPVTVRLPVDRAGVYIVECSALDRLERAQVVSVDLYAGGMEPVAWPRPSNQVFEAVPDKQDYDPGDRARIVLESPFQNAEALVVIEDPDGNRYQWLPVRGGAATFEVPVLGHWAPRIPVHFLLLRGRLPGVHPSPADTTDLGRPATMASTVWLKVNPVAHRVNVQLEHPPKARPGQTIPMTIRLADPKGNPVAGEVTLWLVDAAVLALGKEARLDPVPDFVTDRVAHLVFRDIRNLVFGWLPFAEEPGGEKAEGEGGLFDRTTVRKNFKVVPYYNPSIRVGPDGVARVEIALSDDLTVFRIRAKAASGPERFGWAASEVAVRLPVIVQPALPRFVRPGDSFRAVAIGRIVEGEGGAGRAEAQFEGVVPRGDTSRTLTWDPVRPERIEVPVEVPTPEYDAEGRLGSTEARFRFAVERIADKASDAFEVRLPIRDDRPRIVRRALLGLEPGKPVPLPPVEGAARPGTISRSVLLSPEPGLLRMAAGLDFQRRYPYGCTEQRVSVSRSWIGLRKLRSVLHRPESDAEIDRVVGETLEWIGAAVDPAGLVAYWPGSKGYVSLTAWCVQFLVEAREAGYTVDPALLDRLTRTLEAALRSDYGRFIDGESWAERTWALSALASAGRFQAAYGAELARKSQYVDLEGVAQVALAFLRSGEASAPVMKDLVAALQDGVVTRLHEGREIYGGLQETRPWNRRNGLILPGETRTLAEVTRALRRAEPGSPRLRILVDALVTLGRGDGWGDTNANAEALLALSEVLAVPAPGEPMTVELRFGERKVPVTVGGDSPAGFFRTRNPGEATASLTRGEGPLLAWAETSYIPAEAGSRTPPSATGFVVSREALLVKGEDVPAEKLPEAIVLRVGDVVEDHVRVVNPKERHFVAILAPLAAGMEPLNPNLATAPPEARPRGVLTLAPTYAAYLDDSVGFYYDTLPPGTYDFYFRTRAQVPGRFLQPAATAALMYDDAVRGNSAGAGVEIEPGE